MERAARVALLLVAHPALRRVDALPIRNSSRVLGENWAASTFMVGGDSSSQYEPLAADDEEFLWSRLAGRCCMASHKKWVHGKLTGDAVGATSCEECNEWGSAEPKNNFCHQSAGNCETCGSNVYCDAPPKLLAGNVVCSGSSKVGEGCNDAYTTGVCMDKNIEDCNLACSEKEGCKLFTFYPREKMGSCILCHDVQNFEPTIQEMTRVYALYPVTKPPPPPAYPNKGHQMVKHYQVIKNPSPPPSPPKPPRAPPDLDRQFTCKFMPETELRVDQATGYTELHLGEQEECCNNCGETEGCADFVYEASSGTCVLLPHVEDRKQVKATKNKMTVSGTVVHKDISEHGKCDIQPRTGFAGGQIKNAALAMFGDDVGSIVEKPIKNVQDCCDKCSSLEKCAKFSFSTDTEACLLYEGYAEPYSSSALTAGVVQGRAHINIEEAFSPPPAFVDSLEQYEAMFPILFAKKPSAPPPPDKKLGFEVEATQTLLTVMSICVAGLLLFGLLCCLCLFFSGGKKRADLNKKGKKSRKDKEQRDRFVEIKLKIKVGAISMVREVEIPEEVSEVKEFKAEIVDQFRSLLKREKKGKLEFYYLSDAIDSAAMEDDFSGSDQDGERYLPVLPRTKMSKIFRSRMLLLTDEPIGGDKDAEATPKTGLKTGKEKKGRNRDRKSSEALSSGDDLDG